MKIIEVEITCYKSHNVTFRIFSVSTAALRAGPLPVGKELPVKLVGKKSSQGIGLGASPYGGNIFFSPFTETAIAQFNPKTNEQRWVFIYIKNIYFVCIDEKMVSQTFAVCRKHQLIMIKKILCIHYLKKYFFIIQKWTQILKTKVCSKVEKLIL